MENHSLLRTISGVNFTNSRPRLHLKINKIEKVIDVSAIKIKKFLFILMPVEKV